MEKQILLIAGGKGFELFLADFAQDSEGGKLRTSVRRSVVVDLLILG
jgi:hypothetical protein